MNKDNLLGELIGGGLVIFAIITGTEIIIFPLIIIGLFIGYAIGSF